MSSLPAEVAQHFPYGSVRPYQDRFAIAIFESLEAERHVCLEGPNGLGKTVAARAATLPIAKREGSLIL